MAHLARFAVCVAVLLCCVSASLAQQAAIIRREGTAATAPACNGPARGFVYTVTDALTVTDCTAGGGNNINLCVCNGTNYVDYIQGAEAGPTEEGTIAGAPPCNTGSRGHMYSAINALTSTDCTAGGGSQINLCVCNGTTYVDYALSTDENAIHKTIPAEISALTLKSTPAPEDWIVLESVADANAKRRSTLQSVQDALQGAISVMPENMADATHGDGFWSSGVLTITNVQCGSNCISDNEVDNSITASNYLPLSGGTLSGPLTLDNLGVIFEASNTNTACNVGVYAMFVNLALGKFRKCENGVLSDIGSGSGSGTDAFAFHSNISNEIAALPSKPLPTLSDYLVLESAADGNAKRSILLSTLPPLIQSTLLLQNIPGTATDGQIPDDITIVRSQTLTDGSKGEFTCISGNCTINPNTIEILTDTIGDVVVGATPNQGLVISGAGEAKTLGNIPCAIDFIQKSTGTGWACAPDATGAGGSDNTAIHRNTAQEFDLITDKETLVPSDRFLLEDSQSGGEKRDASLGSLTGVIENTIVLANIPNAVTDPKCQIPLHWTL